MKHQLHMMMVTAALLAIIGDGKRKMRSAS